MDEEDFVTVEEGNVGSKKKRKEKKSIPAR